MLHKTDYCIIFFLMVFVVGSLPTPNKELLVFWKTSFIQVQKGEPQLLERCKNHMHQKLHTFFDTSNFFSKLENFVYTLKSQLRNGLANREKSTGNWVELSVKFCNFCWNCFIRQNIKNSLILEFNLLSTKHILNLNFEEISSITTVSSDLFARDLSVQLKFVYTQFSSNFMEADWRWQKCETKVGKINKSRPWKVRLMSTPQKIFSKK